MMNSLGLMCMMKKSEIMPQFQKIIKEKDPIVRSGAVNMLQMAYFGTGDNKVCSILLDLVATDLSDDVRRSAVLGITFVMINKKEQALKLLKMLSKSYHFYIRHAVALSLGILGAHSFDKQIL